MTARRVWRDAGNDGGGGYGAMPGMTAAAGMMAMLGMNVTAGMMAMLGMNVTAGMTATGGMTSAAIPDGHHRPPLAPPSFPRKRESRGSC